MCVNWIVENRHLCIPIALNMNPSFSPRPELALFTYTNGYVFKMVFSTVNQHWVISIVITFGIGLKLNRNGAFKSWWSILNYSNLADIQILTQATKQATLTKMVFLWKKRTNKICADVKTKHVKEMVNISRELIEEYSWTIILWCCLPIHTHVLHKFKHSFYHRLHRSTKSSTSKCED